MFSFYFALFVYSYSLVLMGSIMWTVLEGFRQLLFKHLNQMLLEVVKKATKKRENFSLSVTYFQKNYIKAVIKVSRCNRFLGSLFLALMLVNFPASLVLLTTLISYTLSGPVWAIVAIIFYQQAFYLFFIHLFIAKLNDQLCNIPKKFFSMILTNNFKRTKILKNLKQNFKLNKKAFLFKNLLFVEIFHTRKPYGFKYHKFGHVSLFNFLKVRCFKNCNKKLIVYCFLYIQYILFYSELLMSVYKNV